MKQNKGAMYQLPFFLILITTFLGSRATVFWDNTMAPDAIDQDVIIDGAVQLKAGANRIQSNSVDITVSVISSSVVRGNDGSPSQLYLTANSGRKITFVIDLYNLSFIGSSDAPLTPLLIVAGGGGTIEFQVRGGKRVQFSRERLPGGACGTDESGPVQFYLFMADPSLSNPVVRFTRETSAAFGSSCNCFFGVWFVYVLPCCIRRSICRQNKAALNLIPLIPILTED